jgi:hypothetical protein
VLQSLQPGSIEDLGACAVVQAKVYDTQQNLIDGATVAFSRSIGTFRIGTEDFGAVAVSTLKGLATVNFCALTERGTAIITAVVQDAVATTFVTIF